MDKKSKIITVGNKKYEAYDQFSKYSDTRHLTCSSVMISNYRDLYQKIFNHNMDLPVHPKDLNSCFRRVLGKNFHDRLNATMIDLWIGDIHPEFRRFLSEKGPNYKTITQSAIDDYHENKEVYLDLINSEQINMIPIYKSFGCIAEEDIKKILGEEAWELAKLNSVTKNRLIAKILDLMDIPKLGNCYQNMIRLFSGERTHKQLILFHSHSLSRIYTNFNTYFENFNICDLFSLISMDLKEHDGCPTKSNEYLSRVGNLVELIATMNVTLRHVDTSINIIDKTIELMHEKKRSVLQSEEPYSDKELSIQYAGYIFEHINTPQRLKDEYFALPYHFDRANHHCRFGKIKMYLIQNESEKFVMEVKHLGYDTNGPVIVYIFDVLLGTHKISKKMKKICDKFVKLHLET